MSTALTEWIYLVGPDLPMCPNPLITREVLETCRDFCERTKLWSEQLTAIDIVEDTAEYQLTSTAGDIVAVKRVEIDDVAIDPISEIAMDRDSDTWRTETANDPAAYFVGEERLLRLVDIPDEDNDDALVVWVYLKPFLTATTVPDWLYDDHRKIIEEGTRARLMMYQNTPWYDPQRASAAFSLYNTATDEKAQKKHQGRTPARVRDILRVRRKIDF